MRELAAEELECLKRIAAGRSGVTTPCPEYLLSRLLAAGLIEQAPRIMLPLPLIRTTYRLTHAGEAALWSGGRRTD